MYGTFALYGGRKRRKMRERRVTHAYASARKHRVGRMVTPRRTPA